MPKVLELVQVVSSPEAIYDAYAIGELEWRFYGSHLGCNISIRIL